jgi:chromosome segregation ATPase
VRSHEADGPIKFDVAFRGYAREPVDEYVGRLHGWLLDSEARADNAVQAASSAVGNKVTEILQAAMEAGEQARREAETNVAKLLEQAEGRAAEVLQFAERRGQQLREEAEALLKEARAVRAAAVEEAKAEADRSIRQARREYESLQKSISGLAARRENALGELARLQEYLAAAPEVEPPAAEDALSGAVAKARSAPAEANPIPLAQPAMAEAVVAKPD